MQDLPSAVLAAFVKDGLLQTASPSFVSRPGQDQLAVEVARTIQSGGVLVAEAGTGVGKTFAYLVPVLLNGQRAVISTASKALQDQLAQRDLPRLVRALNMPVQVQVLKGRSSYVCLHRLEIAAQNTTGMSRALAFQLARVEAWSIVTRTGDLSELADFPERSGLTQRVTSTRDNCLGADCPRVNDCFVNLARRRALVAEVVIINHHLFFSDIRGRDAGLLELLPSVETLIFDEAHRLNDIGIQFLGQQFSSQSIEYLCRDVLAHANVLALGAADWRSWVSSVVQSTGNLVGLLSKVDGPEAPLWNESVQAPYGVESQAWTLNTGKLRHGLKQIAWLLSHLEPAAPGLNALRIRTEEQLGALDTLCEPTRQGYVKWLELSQSMTLACTPVHIRDVMQVQLKSSGAIDGVKKSWIFTSATLGYDNDFTHFKESCGLDDAKVLRVASPFDYASQAKLYVPESFPAPGDPMHSQEVAHLVSQAAIILRGRTLVLATTLRAMREIGAALREHFTVRSDLRVLVQGDASKAEILKMLAAAVSDEQLGVVVVATAPFWEGVDIPGNALQMVVIDKIPFAPPHAPLSRARAKKLSSIGKSPFLDLHLPTAALALKQGVGRLIRAENDRGMLVVCDVRLKRMAYGAKILDQLPLMDQISSRDQWVDALHQLTKFSTTDPY